MSVWKGELLMVALVALLLAVGSVVAALNDSGPAKGMAAGGSSSPPQTQVQIHAPEANTPG